MKLFEVTTIDLGGLGECREPATIAADAIAAVGRNVLGGETYIILRCGTKFFVSESYDVVLVHWRAKIASTFGGRIEKLEEVVEKLERANDDAETLLMERREQNR